MDLLLSLLIFVIIAGLVYWIITLIPLPPPFKTIALVIFGIFVLFYLLGLLGVVPSMAPLRIG